MKQAIVHEDHAAPAETIPYGRQNGLAQPERFGRGALVRLLPPISALFRGFGGIAHVARRDVCIKLAGQTLQNGARRQFESLNRILAHKPKPAMPVAQKVFEKNGVPIQRAASDLRERGGLRIRLPHADFVQQRAGMRLFARLK